MCAASAATTSARRVACRSPRPSRATPPSRRWSLLPCHRTHLPMRHGLSQPSALPCISRPSSFLGSISTPAPPAPYTRPAIPCVCLGRVPHAHSPHTACRHAEQVACLPPLPLPATPPHPTWTAATPSFAHGWVASARAPSRLQPARRRLWNNDLGADAEQALRAAARDGLELTL